MPHEDHPPQANRLRAEDRDPGWVIPFAVGGIALLLGALFFYNYSPPPTLTAVNTTPQMQQTAPPAPPAKQ
jgi:hypothetical protein